MTRNDLLTAVTEQPLVSDLIAQARASAANGNIPETFRAYRHAVASAVSLRDDEMAVLADELATVMPRYLAQGHAADTESFLQSLRIHPNLAFQFAQAVEKNANRQAAALGMTLGVAYAAVGRPQNAAASLKTVFNPGVISAEFAESWKFLSQSSAISAGAAKTGWATQRATPYPLAPDGKPKLNPVWFEVTSFCNQKCSFCPDPWRDTKRQFIDLEVFKRYITELKQDFHVEYLQLNAYGEPLLHPKFEQILNFLRDGNAPCPFYFTTHGMTLNERNISLLDRAHPHGINISLQNDGEASYAASRDLRIGNYEKLATQCRNLVERFVQNRRACHVRLYQLVSNGKEGWGVPQHVLDAFPNNWEKFAESVRRWEDAFRPMANDRTVQAVRNSDDAIREAFETTDQPSWWIKLDLLRWKDERGGEQSVFISPRPISTYANQLPHRTKGWKVNRKILNNQSCWFTKNPGLAIFSNGNLGICCMSVDQNATFGNLADFGSLKEAVSSPACFRFFGELANGVARSHDCQVCLGEVEKTGEPCKCELHVAQTAPPQTQTRMEEAAA